MSLKSKLKAVAEIVGCFVTDPALTRQIVRELPSVVRSERYSRRWSDPAVRPRLTNSSTGRNALRAYFDAHRTGPGIWKWLHYFDIYDRHLQKFRGAELHLLEIGIYSGGSLGMWRDYFGPRCHIYGVDIQEACRVYEDARTQIFIGDQVDRAFWKHVKEVVPPLDVIIDDGGHRYEQQTVTLEELLPHLAPGGVYICEDVHRRRNWFTAYVHALADALNAFEELPATDGDEFQSRATPFQSEIHSVHSYPFVSVIERREGVLPQFTSAMRGTEWQPFLSDASAALESPAPAEPKKLDVEVK